MEKAMRGRGSTSLLIPALVGALCAPGAAACYGKGASDGAGGDGEGPSGERGGYGEGASGERGGYGGAGEAATAQPIARDLVFFLRRLASTDHLPELDGSRTAMYSTWDREGGNQDDADFKRVEGDRNVLLETEGPGCVQRIFTGLLGAFVEGTRIEIYLDREAEPLFRMPVDDFLAPVGGPFTPPLVAGAPYPGLLMPIPFAEHILVQLVSEEEEKKWGEYWQVTYSIYEPGTRVTSLRWPPGPGENEQMAKTAAAWRAALQPGGGAPPASYDVQRWRLRAGASQEIALQGCGIIRRLRVSLQPNTTELLQGVFVRMYWDGEQAPAVDLPVGYLFGNAEHGDDAAARFDSLLMGVTGEHAYTSFPMPFARGARLLFENRTAIDVEVLQTGLRVEPCAGLPENAGRFHAALAESRAAIEGGEKAGPLEVPVHTVLEIEGRGKYVGAMLFVDWPYGEWWGEGDWLIWSDEQGWPPAYHGTGSEEYFNSGWSGFDRKAISGFIKVRPGPVGLYSFHLNDAFQFRERIRVAVETVGLEGGDTIIREQHPTWKSTAFWYEAP
jgi:hypothetical protein